MPALSTGQNAKIAETNGIWHINSQQQWEAAAEDMHDFTLSDGLLRPTTEKALFSSIFKEFQEKRKLSSITFQQSPQWDNWQKIAKVTPDSAVDAPVFVPVGEDNYWLLAALQGDQEYGYHAWHSEDMKSWKHHGPVTSWRNRWVTTAEYLNGTFYIYFDKPNDEQPHLIMDDDLADGKPGREIGMVFDDPSHGSDMAIFRDGDGTFHMIYEDWTPLNPREHSWDSPLAGHTNSPDGYSGFKHHEFKPPIDERAPSTGSTAEYAPASSHFVPNRYAGPFTYQIPEKEQDAFGDYTMIKVGGHYYLFCDYDPKEDEKSMRVGRWRSDDIYDSFIWDGEIGEGFHPDPTIGFAEGKFYLIVQRSDHDFVSSGPWVDGVEARAGVDTDKDGQIDQWTEFQEVSESYSQKAGFVRVIESEPAKLLTNNLPAGYGFTFEFRVSGGEFATPVMDAIQVEFE
ncbi:MAG: hypothetical protein U5K72_18285 [Balneolaceae bacterium]|nr:hypothetical protein [Balneolaceae bacterium]